MIDLRRAANGALQEGVMSSGAWMVTQRAAGVNLSVDIAANVDMAYVQGDSVTPLQGLYPVAPHSAVINETIAAANPSLPRIDIVILEIQDNVHDSSGGNLARTRVLTGTATSGANLTNRTGAPSLPNNALLLADVAVAAGDTSTSNASIRDRRKWARGAYKVSSVAGTVGTYTSTTAGLMDATNLQPRIECSGLPIEARLTIPKWTLTANKQAELQVFVDGVITASGDAAYINNVSQDQLPLEWTWYFTPSAGSHKIGPAVNVASASSFVVGGLRLDGSTNLLTTFTLREMVSQNAANNSVTTG